jgi:hypothetical protein
MRSMTQQLVRRGSICFETNDKQKDENNNEIFGYQISEKKTSVHSAGKIKFECCGNHVKSTHTHKLCRQNAGFFKSKADDIYSYVCVFKWSILL